MPFRRYHRSVIHQSFIHFMHTFQTVHGQLPFPINPIQFTDPLFGGIAHALISNSIQFVNFYHVLSPLTSTSSTLFTLLGNTPTSIRSQQHHRNRPHSQPTRQQQTIRAKAWLTAPPPSWLETLSREQPLPTQVTNHPQFPASSSSDFTIRELHHNNIQGVSFGRASGLH